MNERIANYNAINPAEADPANFNQEELVHLQGSIPSPEALSDAESRESYHKCIEVFIGMEYSASDLEIMRLLDVEPIAGLPLIDNSYQETYALMVKADYSGKLHRSDKVLDYDLDGYPIYDESYTLEGFDTTYEGATRLATTFPYAGRATTLEEGLILDDTVYVNHDIKNVGLTGSADNSYIRAQAKAQSDINPVGVENASLVQHTFRAEEKMRASGVLTCKVLPPIELDDIWYRGKRTNLPENMHLWQMNRAYASNVRVNALYEAVTASGFHEIDLTNILKDPELTYSIMLGRVSGYLEDVKKIKKYNDNNETSYKMGCSEYMDSSSPEDYAMGFRRQLLKNVASMISNDVWQGNPSPQNLTIAGEIVDLAEVDYVENNVLIDDSESIELSDDALSNLRKRGATSMLTNYYMAQGVVTSVLGNTSDFYSMEDMWKDIQSELLDDCWAKEYSYDDVVAGSQFFEGVLYEEKATRRIWKAFKDLDLKK